MEALLNLATRGHKKTQEKGRKKAIIEPPMNTDGHRYCGVEVCLLTVLVGGIPSTELVTGQWLKK